MGNDSPIDPEGRASAWRVGQSGALLAWHLLLRSAHLHVQRKLVWTGFPRSKALARAGMAPLSVVVGVACWKLGLDVLSSVTLAAVSWAGMEQSMRIVGDPRWAVAYVGAGLSAILMASAVSLLSPMLGTLIAYVGMVTAIRLSIVAFATGSR